MKKKLVAFLVIPLALISFNFIRVSNVGAISTICNDSNLTAGSASGSAYCNSGSNDPILGSSGILSLVINLLAAIAGLVAVIMIIISAIQLINSGGSSEKVAKARDTIIFACVGLVVVVLARILVLFIVSKIP
jgi:hypothetical protein